MTREEIALVEEWLLEVIYDRVGCYSPDLFAIQDSIYGPAVKSLLQHLKTERERQRDE